MAGRGRKRNDPKVASPEALELARFLREEVLDANHMTLRTLAARLNLGRSTLSNRLDGRPLSWQFVERLVEAAVPAASLEHYRLRARRLWEAADKPAPGGLGALALAGPTPDEKEVALERLVAGTRDELARAAEHNQRLGEDLRTTQRMVVLLTMLSAQLHTKLQTPGTSPQELQEAQERVAVAEQQLAQVQRERQDSEALLGQMRERINRLEELLAKASRTAVPVAEPESAFELPPELDQDVFLADPGQALATTEALLARTRERREQLRADVALPMAPLVRVRRTAERWSAASLLLGRIVGCTWTITGVVMEVVATHAPPSAWIGLAIMSAVPFIWAGLVLVSDPWDTFRRLWPIPRALLRREKVPWPIEVDLATLTSGVIRVVTLMVAAFGAHLSADCVYSGNRWWLVALIPAMFAAVLYTLVGHDPHLRAVAKAAARDVTGNLRAPAAAAMVLPNRAPADKVRVAVLDSQWLQNQRTWLRELVDERGRTIPFWVKLLAVLWLWVLLSRILTSMLLAVNRTLHGPALVGTVDLPVRHYLADHTQGLAVTAAGVHVLWLAAGLGLLLFSIVGSFAARLTWTAWGAASVAMVWAGSALPGRQVATGITALAWGIASIVALLGMRLRAPATVINNNDHTYNDHSTEAVNVEGDPAD